MKDLARPVAVLTGLWALAAAQPILDALRRAPEFFVAHRADVVDAVVVAAVLTLAVPIALAAVLLLVRAFSRKLLDPVTAALAGVLAAALVVQVAYRLGVTGWPGTIVVAALVILLLVIAIWP